jgi:hypothetical protein
MREEADQEESATRAATLPSTAPNQ